MLESIRKYSNNPVFKVLFGLIILAFAVSGIVGLKFGGDEDYAAKVGSKKISRMDIEKRYQQMLSSLGPEAAQVSEEQLAAFGVSRSEILKNTLQSSLVAQEVDHVGIAVGENSVKAQIKKMPIFRDETGAFRPEKFQEYLQKINTTEASFTADMKDDLENLILVSSIMNNTPKNMFVAEEVAKAVKVTRDISVIKIPANHVKAAAAPTEEQLKSFYFENSFNYKLPEMREVSFIKFPKPAAEDKAGYEKINQIEDDIAGGSTLQEIATKVGAKIEENKTVFNSQQLLFNKAAYATAEGKVSKLGQDEKGEYFVIQVNKIKEAAVPELAEVKEQVTKDWKAKKEKDENIIFSQSILAEVKDGKSMAEAAASKGLPFEKIANFSSEDQRFGEEFILSIFNTGAGSVTGSIPDGKGGYIIAKVDALNQQPITPKDVNDALAQGGKIFQQELFAQYMAYLEKKYPIKLNPALSGGQPAGGAPKPAQQAEDKKTNANPA